MGIMEVENPIIPKGLSSIKDTGATPMLLINTYGLISAPTIGR
jgi:hypothetical protein